MSLQQQTVQAAGAVVTSTGAFAAFITAAMPVLQFFIAVGTLIVMTLTGIYTWKRIKDKKSD